LTLGGQLPELSVAYETWGRLNEDKSNAILLFTGLSASSHAKSHGVADKPGWWEGMIDRTGGLDPERFFIICLNHLGGCFGSTGPASPNPATGKPYGPDFPPIMIQDLAVTAYQVTRHLGIDTLFCAMGASMGGMLALEYAARYADKVQRVVMISASGRPGPQSIAYRYVQRQVILCDPTWAGGWYYDKVAKPDVAMAVARQIGNITYRSAREFKERFGRSRTGQGYTFGPDFQVESYLNHMGYKLASHFDANSFLFLSKAMDLYSLGHGFSTYEAGVARIRARTLIIGVSSDMLFPPDEQRDVYEILDQQGRDVSFDLLQSTAGHDAFLVDVDYFREKIGSFLGAP
jgi:homoserine O-acetyltransferase